MNRWSWLLAGLALVGCTRANPDFCDADQPCAGDRVCDLGGVLGSRNACVTPICSPEEVLSCDGAVAEICADNQLETATETCEFGCNASGCLPCPAGGRACREVEPGVSELAVCAEDGSVIDRRDCVLGCSDTETCTDIVPSNDLDMDLGFIDGNLSDITDLELEDGFTVNSDGTITDAAGQPITAPSSRQRVPGLGPTMRVFRVRQLSVSGEVTLVGPDVIAFVANSDIRISGVLIVRAGGATDPLNDCVGEAGTQLSIEDAGGSGGGGFESTGGRGGRIDSAGGGAGGQGIGNSTLIPLFGGCAGGGDMGGAGGGGLQLVSRSRIVLEPGAGINAGGQGGSAPVSVGVTPPGGGGSGGGLLLEAPVIDVAETAFIAANGGGGGCTGVPSISQAGGDGELGAAQASGGECGGTNFGRGGRGGSKADNREDGQDKTDTGGDDSGGGGGGSVGRIRVNSILGVPSSSRFSPDPSVGTLDSF